MCTSDEILTSSGGGGERKKERERERERNGAILLTYS